MDALGHYLAPLAYAQMQVVTEAVEKTKSLDCQVLADFTRSGTFSTVMGNVTFAKLDEWQTPRVLQVQFQGITGDDLEQYRNGSRQIVVSLVGKASGILIYPFADALSR